MTERAPARRRASKATTWQFEQAYASLQEYLRSGRKGGVGPDAIHHMFDKALGLKQETPEPRLP